MQLYGNGAHEKCLVAALVAPPPSRSRSAPGEVFPLLALPTALVQHVALQVCDARDVRALRHSCRQLAAATSSDTLQRDWLLMHHMCDGTAIDRAAGAGSARLVRMLLDAGCDPLAWREGAAPRQQPATLNLRAWAMLPLHDVGALALSMLRHLPIHTAAYHGNATVLSELLAASQDPTRLVRLAPVAPEQYKQWLLDLLPPDLAIHLTLRSYVERNMRFLGLPSPHTTLVDLAVYGRQPSATLAVLLAHRPPPPLLAPLIKAANCSDATLAAVLPPLLGATGANPNRQLKGRAPLHLAAQRGLLRACQALLAAGADPNLVTPDTRFALLYAAAGGHEEVVQLLLAAGADANRACEPAVTGVSEFSLVESSKQGHVRAVRALLRAGADPNRTLVVDTAVARRMAERVLHGVSPVSAAAGHGHLEVVQALMAAGADPSVRDVLGAHAFCSAFCCCAPRVLCFLVKNSHSSRDHSSAESL